MKQEYECPECGKKWLYSAMELKFAKADGHCHECADEEEWT